MGRLHHRTRRASYESGNSPVKRVIAAVGTTTDARQDTHGPLCRQRVRRWRTETRPVCPGRRSTRDKKAEPVLQDTLRLTECPTIRKKLRADRYQGVDGRDASARIPHWWGCGEVQRRRAPQEPGPKVCLGFPSARFVPDGTSAHQRCQLARRTTSGPFVSCSGRCLGMVPAHFPHNIQGCIPALASLNCLCRQPLLLEKVV
jgi:hypothetical protein